MTTLAVPFTQTPLITPERIAGNYQEAFTAIPEWIQSLTFILPSETTTGITSASRLPFKPILDVSPVAVVQFGKTVISHKTLSLLGLAVAFEITRMPGVSITTDSNGSGRYYERITIARYSEDLTTLSRLLFGAAEDQQVKANGFTSELRPEHLKAIPAAKASKDARAIVLAHLERIATNLEARGGLPSHFTAAAYVENVQRLLGMVDLEATGIDPIATLQGPYAVTGWEAA